MRRPREGIDLPAGVVDVILPRHRVTGEVQQRRERIADDRAPAMSHMHRTRRVGRDIFDIDRLAAAHFRTPVIGPGGADRDQFIAPDFGLQCQVEKSRSGDLGPHYLGQPRQFLGEHGGDVARLQPRRLGEHHRCIGRQIAVAGITRRFDGDSAKAEA